MIGFVIGVFIGAVFGVAIMALCVASSKEPPAMINNMKQTKNYERG